MSKTLGHRTGMPGLPSAPGAEELCFLDSRRQGSVCIGAARERVPFCLCVRDSLPLGI